MTDPTTQTLRADHWCSQDIGLNAGCGEEAYDLRAREWMCPAHINRYDWDVEAGRLADLYDALPSTTCAECAADGEPVIGDTTHCERCGQRVTS